MKKKRRATKTSTLAGKKARRVQKRMRRARLKGWEITRAYCS